MMNLLCSERMNWFEKVLHFLSAEVDEAPAIFGLYHVICFIVMVAVTVVMSKFFAKAEDKKFRLVVGICWAIVVVFEIYKQLIYSFEWTGTETEWSYQWYAFPYQFCSMILFVSPFVFLIRDGVVRDGAECYLATYSLFGGLVVFIYPGDVFIDIVGIDIQTMVHHGMQIIIGVLMLVKNKDRLNLKFLLKGFAFFVVLIGVAQLLNAVVPPYIGDQTFNMFYISWKYDCTLPLLSIIYPLVPYWFFLVMYAVGVTIAAVVVMYAAVGINKLVNKIKAKKGSVNA